MENKYNGCMPSWISFIENIREELKVCSSGSRHFGVIDRSSGGDYSIRGGVFDEYGDALLLFKKGCQGTLSV